MNLSFKHDANCFIIYCWRDRKWCLNVYCWEKFWLWKGECVSIVYFQVSSLMYCNFLVWNLYCVMCTIDTGHPSYILFMVRFYKWWYTVFMDEYILTCSHSAILCVDQLDILTHLTLFRFVGTKIVPAYVFDFIERAAMSEITWLLFFHSFKQFLFYEKKNFQK